MSGTQVTTARSRAAKRGLLADLTENDWEQTCRDLNQKCAYCGRSGSSLDHFQPLSSGGPSSINNCILSCEECNRLKSCFQPAFFLRQRPELLIRIQQYLSTRQSGLPGLPFWTFPLLVPEKNQPTYLQGENHLNKETMQSTPFTLANGTTLCIYNDEQNTVLQLCQPAVDTDPLAYSIQIGTSLTAPECLELAAALIGYASKKVVAKPAQKDAEKEEEKPAFSWNTL